MPRRWPVASPTTRGSSAAPPPAATSWRRSRSRERTPRSGGSRRSSRTRGNATSPRRCSGARSRRPRPRTATTSWTSTPSRCSTGTPRVWRSSGRRLGPRWREPRLNRRSAPAYARAGGGRMSTYPMTEEDRRIQETAGRFVDEELIPWENHAEEHGGRIPDEARERHHRSAIDLGLFAMNMPKELGGGGFTMFQQVLVSEQIGRVTNALGWCVHTPPAWAPDVVTPEQLERWIVPTIRGERQECYAITEAGAGSDVDAIQATARRDDDAYVLNGTKMHVTSYNTADYLFFQGKIDGGPHAGEHAMFFVDKDTPGVHLVREPAYSHTYADSHAIVRFDDVRVPATSMVGEEGDGLDFTYAWFRYERLIIAARCCGAAEPLIEEATVFAKHRVQFGEPIVR